MKTSKGFTLIELLIVMAVIAILIAIAIPSFRGMQMEARKTKAQGDVRVIKIAIESYYKNHNNLYPVVANYQTVLQGAVPQILQSTLNDPFSVGASSPYQYAISGATPSASDYYIIWSVGPNQSAVPATVSTAGIVTATNEVIWESNGHL